MEPENRNRIQKSETRNCYKNSESILNFNLFENFRNQKFPKPKNVFLKKSKIDLFEKKNKNDFPNSETILKILTYKMF